MRAARHRFTVAVKWTCGRCRTTPQLQTKPQNINRRQTAKCAGSAANESAPSLTCMYDTKKHVNLRCDIARQSRSHGGTGGARAPYRRQAWPKPKGFVQIVQIRDFLGRGVREETALLWPPSWRGGGPLRCPSPKIPAPHRPFGPRHRCTSELWNPGA